MIIDLTRFHVPSRKLKRQMFGRANFALLCKRVLLVT
jgi:transposase